MISTLKPLKSEEIMETPRRVWKQLLYVKVVGPLVSPGGPTPEHPALAYRSDIWINPIVKMIHKAVFWHCIK